MTETSGYWTLSWLAGEVNLHVLKVRWGCGLMTVYVDDVQHAFGRMVFCHLWADSLDELLAMVDRIGVQRKWLQQPPKASWVHFDISLSKKKLAIAAGAVLTDMYEPVLHRARLEGNQRMIAKVLEIREREKTQPSTADLFGAQR